MNHQASDQSAARLQQLEKLAHELVAAMPTDVMLKGDGSIWVTTHGNAGTTPRRLPQHEVLGLLYLAVKCGVRMTSI